MRKKAGRTKRRKGRDKKEERAWKRREKIKKYWETKEERECEE